MEWAWPAVPAIRRKDRVIDSGEGQDEGRQKQVLLPAPKRPGEEQAGVFGAET